MSRKVESGDKPSDAKEFEVHRIGEFERKDLIKIMRRYTAELMGTEQPPLSKEEVEWFELGRRAFGHLSHRKVNQVRKIEVYQTGPGVDDIRLRVFEEEQPIFTRSVSSKGANSRGPRQ